VLKHLLHPRRVFGHVDVLEGNPPFAVVLPGGRGVGSGVLAKDQHFVRHALTLPVKNAPVVTSEPIAIPPRSSSICPPRM
jgi:hypothetical protein